MARDLPVPLAVCGRHRLPEDVPAPRVAGLSRLLGEIDSLRTSLQADLSLAAAAADAGASALCVELVNGDRRAVHAFEVRTLAHLQAMAEAEAAEEAGAAVGAAGAPQPATAQPATAGPATARPASSTTRGRRFLPSAPVLVAAAALVGFVAGVIPGGAAPQPVVTPSSASAASAELSRLGREGAPPEELRQAAELLHDGVVEMVAGSGGRPSAAAEGLLLLQQGTGVLVLSGDQRPLQGVLAEARSLTEQLRRTLAPVAVEQVTAGLVAKVPAPPPVPLRLRAPRPLPVRERPGTAPAAVPTSGGGPTGATGVTETVLPVPALGPAVGWTGPEPERIPTGRDEGDLLLQDGRLPDSR